MDRLFSNYMEIAPFDLVKYHHGFIDDKATLPSSFCSLGVQRFEHDLKKYDCVSGDILKSLEDQVSKYGDPLLVYPVSFNKKRGPFGPLG